MEKGKREDVKLTDLKPKAGSRHRRKIVGRGEGSGHGGSATRGMKGQKARSGDGKMIGFEGGQIPLLRRIPKRGFSREGLRDSVAIVNVSTLDAHFSAGEKVDPEILLEKGLVSKADKIKILGDGELKKSLTVTAHAFSKSAEQKIAGAGGSVQKC